MTTGGLEQTSERNDLGGTTLAAFAGAVIIGGANYVAVSFSNRDLEPMFGATLRFAAASLLFFAIAVVARLPLPKGRAAVGAGLYGALGFGLAYGLLYFALTGLGAGTASIITASAPLMTLILAVAHRQERFSIRGLIGGLLAISGIGILSAGDLGSDVRAAHLIAAVLAVFAIAESSVLVKAYPRTHPVTTNAVGMAAGAILLGLASLLFREQWALPSDGRTWAVLLWLVVMGSVGLFALFLYVIARWTASASVYALTLMPVVAVALGALLADEPLTLNVMGGGALVLAAVYVGALRRTPGDDVEQASAIALGAKKARSEDS